MARPSNGFLEYYESQVLDLAGSVGLRIQKGRRKVVKGALIRVVPEALPSRVLLRMSRPDHVPISLLSPSGECDLLKKKSLLSEEWGMLADAMGDKFIADTIADQLETAPLKLSRATVCSDDGINSLTVQADVTVRYEIPIAASLTVERRADRDGPHPHLSNKILTERGMEEAVAWQWNVGWLWRVESGHALCPPEYQADRRYICIEYKKR